MQLPKVGHVDTNCDDDIILSTIPVSINTRHNILINV